MAWDSEQPQQRWEEAFRGIPSAFNKDLADDIQTQADDETMMGVVILRVEALEAVAKRINELAAIVSQNALVAVLEPEADDEP